MTSDYADAVLRRFGAVIAAAIAVAVVLVWFWVIGTS
jgi:hypothetical protein